MVVFIWNVFIKYLGFVWRLVFKALLISSTNAWIYSSAHVLLSCVSLALWRSDASNRRYHTSNGL